MTVSSNGPVSATGDETLLTQAISNLVTNAARVARTAVQISVFPGLIRVEDDGPGLPGDLSALMAPFVTETVSDGDRSIAAGALGLGLYIAHRVLADHDGGLGVERSDDRGTALLAYVGRALT